jgi:hypothetical protein
MGWDIQINPTAEAFPITYSLVELLDDWATDFEMKYCYIEKDPRLIALLQTYRPADDAEATVVEQLIRQLKSLEDEERVELLFGH